MGVTAFGSSHHTPHPVLSIIPEKPKPIRIAEYAPTFLARMQSSGLKRSTLTMYESNLNHHILPGLGNVDLAAINYKCVADFLSSKATATYSTGRYRVERPPYKRNFSKSRPVPKHHDYPEALDRHYSRDSIRIMVMTLRALMGEATKDQIVPVNPITGMSRFYRRRRKDREVRRSDVFTADELHAIEDRLAEHCPEHFELSLSMSREGMRIGEAMALTIHDIDWQRGTILINKNVPAGIGRLEDSTKTEPSDREIEFWSKDFRLALEAMLKQRQKEWTAKGGPTPEFLFCERSGHMINYSRFVKVWNHVQKLAGVRQRSPHSLRHYVPFLTMSCTGTRAQYFPGKWATRHRHSMDSSSLCREKGVHREVEHRQPSSFVASAGRPFSGIYRTACKIAA
jgi:integrase